MLTGLERVLVEWSRREQLRPVERILAVTYLVVISVFALALWGGALFLLYMLGRWVWFRF